MTSKETFISTAETLLKANIQLEKLYNIGDHDNIFEIARICQELAVELGGKIEKRYRNNEKYITCLEK